MEKWAASNGLFVNVKALHTTTLEEAKAERARLWRIHDGPHKLYLINAATIMASIVDMAVTDYDFPSKWDPVKTKKQIIHGLLLTETALSQQQKVVFHLDAAIGVDRSDQALAIGVDKKTVASTASSMWKRLKAHGAAMQQLRWFIEEKTNGIFIHQATLSITKEMEQDTEAAEKTEEEIRKAYVNEENTTLSCGTTKDI
ncbi:hypothetical protein ACFZB4_43115 [Streptomyces pseudovenezuelae]|uniref:hypothetical protein n=1 Tax=Streptomyces pseudovenezuelae TaxID=67350 RepID=UPI0036F09765